MQQILNDHEHSLQDVCWHQRRGCVSFGLVLKRVLVEDIRMKCGVDYCDMFSMSVNTRIVR